nr:reverse transcriptase domain-containing protein [Tanacetum cinerariifolium]
KEDAATWDGGKSTWEGRARGFGIVLNEAFDEPTEMQRGLDELIKHRSDGSLYYLDRIWVPLKGDVRTLIMDEAHKSRHGVPISIIFDHDSHFTSMFWQLMQVKGKLAPRFVGPFEITERIGPVTYRLRLHKELNGVYDTFYVANLKKCLANPTLLIPLDEIQVDTKLNFMEEPVEILEIDFKKLKRSRISIVKVRWNSKRGPEFT